MQQTIRTGQRIPHAFVAELDERGEVRSINVEHLFAGVKAMIIGVPGAFTPICTQQHLPPFIGAADALKRAGFRHVTVMCPSDPFALDAWQRQIDPQRKLRFLSDGNLSFTRAAGLVSFEDALFLGERSKRYAMTLESAIVTKLAIEQSVLSVTCTTPDDVMDLD